MKMRVVAPILLGIALVLVQAAGAFGSEDFEYYPDVQYDPEVPTLVQIVGHDWGSEISSHSEVERYLQALSQASPKVSLHRYGETWEGRALYYLVVASPANQQRLDAIRESNRQLAEPDRREGAVDRLIAELPATVWLAYAVHGNEISSTDAALLTAYHLAAAQTDAVVDSILKNVVVIINPLQNADGRDRFVYSNRQTRSRWPDEDPQAAEHHEDWPSGRMNHYLFDLNRDWFAQTQQETRGHAAAYLQWFPQIFVDLHEMGANSTYYFAPPADPLNPEITAPQNEWLQRIGRNNARWFDRFRFDYFTREVFDSFYPGYGESWPLFHGSIGMTYEQASAGSLVVRRNDETLLRYQDGVQRHFLASLSTAQVAAENREQLLRYFADYRRSAIQEGRQGPVREYLLAPGPDPARTAAFVSLLMRQGIRVRQASQEFERARVRSHWDGQFTQKRSFPAGTYSILLAQPAKRLIQTLMDRHTPMGETFLQEQIRRHEKRLGDEIYDVTGWSFPLVAGLDAFSSEDGSSGPFRWLEEGPTAPGEVIGGVAEVAYLVPWGSNAAARLLASLLREKIRIHSSDKSFTLQGRTYPPGSLIIKVRDNPEDLLQRLQEQVAAHSVQIYAANESWVDDGINLGSNQVRYLKPPRVALAYDAPTAAYSAGWTRYLLERAYGYPVTIVPCSGLARMDLSRYDVLILPDSWGGYGNTWGEREAGRIKDWVSGGGTLIAFEGATRWLTEEKVGLLATQRELKKSASKAKQKTAEGSETPQEEPAEEISLEPDEEYPPSTPGALFRVDLDTEHWLAFGYPGRAAVMVGSSNIFTPIKLDKGTNVARYAEQDALLSGFTWEAALEQLPGKAYLMHQPWGRGHVVAFAEDPNFRAFMDGLNLLFLNAVFLGPAH